MYVSLVRKSKFGLHVCLLENEVLPLFVKPFSDFSSNLNKIFSFTINKCAWTRHYISVRIELQIQWLILKFVYAKQVHCNQASIVNQLSHHKRQIFQCQSVYFNTGNKSTKQLVSMCRNIHHNNKIL